MEGRESDRPRRHSIVARSATLLAALAVTLAPSSARADDPLPDSVTIRERIAAAAGPHSTTFRETYETTRRGEPPEDVSVVRRGADFRQDTRNGPFRTQRGVYRAQAWHQNDNGQTVVDQPDPGFATSDLSTTTVSRITKPVSGYVIATMNGANFGSKDYVDAATWRVVRNEQIRATGTIATTFDEWIPEHGFTFSHHSHVEDGIAKSASDTRVIAYDASPVADADLTIPASRRTLITFPAGTKTVRIPAQFGTNHIYVRVTINGRGLDFALDTGAAGITIDSTVAHELALPQMQKRESVAAGRYTTYRTIVPEMRVGDLELRDAAVQVVPQGWQTNEGVKEVGLLGFDFIAELGLTIDYEHKIVTATRGSEYAAPTDPHATALDVRLGNEQPNVTATINGAVGERWIIDTGGAGTFIIFDYFARRHPEALYDNPAGAKQGAKTFLGIGGTFETQPCQIGELQLGNITFTNVVGYRVVSNAAYAGASDGLIGTAFLQYFTVGLDYAASRIYLVPNTTGRKVMGIRE